MALKKTTATVHGLTASDAYHRVEAVSLIGKDQISFYVRSYVQQDKPFFAEQTINSLYDMDGENPFKQAYEHLKTLPEFAGAIDC